MNKSNLIIILLVINIILSTSAAIFSLRSYQYAEVVSEQVYSGHQILIETIYEANEK